MADDLQQMVENVKTELNSETFSLRTNTGKELKGDAAKAYLAGYEVGYKDGVNGVPADPIKEEEKMIVEPTRITLPWWP